MFLLKKIISALILPPTGLVLLVLCGLWVMRSRPRAGRALALAGLALLLALSLPVVRTPLMQGLEQHPVIPQAQLHSAQALVVLGAGIYPGAPEYGGDTVSRHSLERVRYAAHLQRAAGLPALFSGGSPYGGKPEGQAMAEVMQELGGIARWAETRSRDTRENAEFSATMLHGEGIRRIVLVSHAWHLRRAVELFERQGFTVIPAPMGFSRPMPDGIAAWLPSADALLDSSLALKEWLGKLVQ